MREIIFRGKLKVDNGEHKKGDWVFGDLVRIKDGEKTSTMIYGFGEVDPSTVAQYTGLTDQNGTKIFEWDIIQHDFGSDQIGVQYAVGGVYNGPMVKYLAHFAIYPQLEMLQKLGHIDVVRALINTGSKSSPYVNWRAESITDFFKMSKQEYNAFKENGGTLELLRLAYKLRSGKAKLNFAEAKERLDCFGSEYNIDRFMEAVKKADISLNEAFKYVLKEDNYSGYADYLRMAGDLGYDLSVHNVAFPKNLKEAHDNAAAAERALIEERRTAALKKLERAAQKYLKKYEKQYSFTNGKYSIVIPHTVEEIINEGKAMKHCVGGYAGRHMEGTLAILFLRLAAEPNKSLYTIEMHDKTLTQVQGYNNRTPLTPEAKAFFDMWLAWVKSGSKRTKTGEPISVPKTVTKTA